jgi:hypothetical protein
MNKLFTIAAIILGLATAANAGDFADVVTIALKKRFPDLQETSDISFLGKDEVTFYTPKSHMSCRYSYVPAVRKDKIKSISFSKCRIIHG